MTGERSRDESTRPSRKLNFVNTELTVDQSTAAAEQLGQLDSATCGELRVWLRLCFHAAITRSIMASLTRVPWSYDEETLAVLIGKSKGTLSHLKTPGKSDERAPAYLALRSLWQAEILKQSDAQTTEAVLHLFRYGCVQFFERLGIFAFGKLLAGESNPNATSDLISVRQLRWIQEAVFILGWHPGDAATISFERIRGRYSNAESNDFVALAKVMSDYGRSALLFYFLSSGAKFDDY